LAVALWLLQKDRKDLSISDSAFAKGSDASGEYDASMSPEDLSGPILAGGDTGKETGRGSNGCWEILHKKGAG
jgi:hypothetical protein